MDGELLHLRAAPSQPIDFCSTHMLGRVYLGCPIATVSQAEPPNDVHHRVPIRIPAHF